MLTYAKLLEGAVIRVAAAVPTSERRTPHGASLPGIFARVHVGNTLHSGADQDHAGGYRHITGGLLGLAQRCALQRVYVCIPRPGRLRDTSTCRQRVDDRSG